MFDIWDGILIFILGFMLGAWLLHRDYVKLTNTEKEKGEWDG